ncbi:MAG: hypothetical protein ACXVC6_14425 [Bacteroidia bacterium]
MRFGNIFSFIGLSYLFSSFSYPFNNLVLEARERASKIVLYSGIGIIVIGIALKLCDLNGANIVIVVGFSIVAFTYATILSTIRKEKWAGYAQKKWQVVLMRFGDISGIGFLVSGVLGKFLDWSFSGIFLVMGAALLIASMIVWNKLFSTEVVLRKQAEDELKKAFDDLRKQHEIIEEKNKEILDSLHYAKRIQQALLPQDVYIAKNLKEKGKGT